MAEAEQLGVTGTPTFFINGKPVKGAVTFATLKAQIDQELDQRMVRNHHASFSRIALPQLLTSSIQDPCTSFPSPNVPMCTAADGGQLTDTLSLYPGNPSLAVNCSAQFSVLLGPAALQCDFTTRIQHWTSSNPSVATISATGHVLALSVGTTTITDANPNSDTNANTNTDAGTSDHPVTNLD